MTNVIRITRVVLSIALVVALSPVFVVQSVIEYVSDSMRELTDQLWELIRVVSGQ